MNTTLTVKMPKKLRDDAKRTAQEIGVPLTTVINALARQFVRDRALLLEAECPFPSHTPNAATRKALRNVDQRKNLTTFDSFGDFAAYVRAI